MQVPINGHQTASGYNDLCPLTKHLMAQLRASTELDQLFAKANSLRAGNISVSNHHRLYTVDGEVSENDNICSLNEMKLKMERVRNLKPVHWVSYFCLVDRIFQTNLDNNNMFNATFLFSLGF